MVTQVSAREILQVLGCKFGRASMSKVSAETESPQIIFKTNRKGVDEVLNGFLMDVKLPPHIFGNVV